MKNGGRLGAALLALCLLLCGCTCGAAQREGAASDSSLNLIVKLVEPARLWRER